MASQTIDMSSQTQAEKGQNVLAALALLAGGQLDSEDDIIFEGDTLKIPVGWTIQRARQLLEKREEDDEQVYNVVRDFNYRPADGSRATARVIKRVFGMTLGARTPGFFRSNPPTLVSVQIDVDKHEQVPSGRLLLPHFDGAYVDLSATMHPELGIIFRLSGACKRREKDALEGLFMEIEKELRANSIYRGKVITASETPEFVDLSGFDPEDVVYTQQVTHELGAFVWTNIDYPQALRDANQIGKRSIVLTGKYGVGKTLAMLLTAHRARKRLDEGLEPITTIVVRPGLDRWEYAMQLARLLGRCVIFVEDVDTLVQHDPMGLSRLLDEMDGLRTKGADVTTVFTTNHINRLHKGMLRPGRIDAVIEIDAMDREGVERLTRRVVGDKLQEPCDFDRVYKSVDGFTPAFVKAALDRAVRFSIYRNQGELGTISEDDIVFSAESLRKQEQLMHDAPEKKEDSGLVGELTTLINQAVRDVVETRLNGAEFRDIDGDKVGELVTN